MKAIIKGLLYNTETATKILTFRNNGALAYLYVTENNNFFYETRNVLSVIEKSKAIELLELFGDTKSLKKYFNKEYDKA